MDSRMTRSRGNQKIHNPVITIVKKYNPSPVGQLTEFVAKNRAVNEKTNWNMCTTLLWILPRFR
jgi:hypothetical protein